MNILIIGAGITGHAASVHLSNLSQEVTLYTRSDEKAKLINEKGIKASGIIEGTYKIKATSNLKEGLSKAEYIFIFTQANAHKDVFKSLKGLLSKGQKIIVFNSNWGAYEGLTILEDELENKEIILGETGSMPFISSLEKTGVVNLLGIKENTKISTLNTKDSLKVKEELKGIFKNILISNNVIETSITATNPVIHVPVTLFNIARIENSDEFKFYGEGTSELGVKYVEEIDKERVKIAEKLGIKCPSILDSINSFWTKKYDRLIDALRENYPDAKAPKSIDYRYLDEDIPYGLVPIIKLGELLEIETPYSKAIVDIVGLYKNIDYYNIGLELNLEKLLEINKLQN